MSPDPARKDSNAPALKVIDEVRGPIAQTEWDSCGIDVWSIATGDSVRLEASLKRRNKRLTTPVGLPCQKRADID